MIRKMMALLTLLGALFLAPSAQAALVFDGWSLDLRTIDGLSNTSTFIIADIREFAFTAVAHAVTDPGLDGVVNTGDTTDLEGLGALTSILTTAGPVLNPFGLNALEADPIAYEITFVFSTTTVFTDNFGNFTHTPVGSLEFYVDKYNGTTTKCNLGDGTDCDDSGSQGVLIASFDFLAGGGGSLNLVTLDGSDDASLEATFLLAGVWFDDLANDLGCDDSVAGSECLGLTLGLTNANFDADFDTNNVFDTQVGGFDCGGGSAQSLVNFCIEENGGFTIASIPEPATLGIFGLGLLGLGFFARRQRRKA